jgi:glyoxylase-like metal-dependent hydrolase (beta-lactamase superfamily II)
MPPTEPTSRAERPPSIRAGSWRVTALSDGAMRLDGGSMWGVVPAAIWRKLTPPAPDNTIPIALRPFLAEKDDLKVVIEVGIGNRWGEKLRRVYAIEPEPSLEASLRACGVAPEAVTHVVASHCHWDHFGSALVERRGAVVPLFPNARHFAPGVEIEVALRPGHVRRASYRREDVEPLLRAGLLEGYEGSSEILPGLRAHVLGGHSDGVSVITLGEEGDGGAIFWSDVVPTTHHVQPAYIMAYDLDVARSYEQRSAWLERAAERRWAGLFYHDVDTPFARVERDGGRYAAVGVEAR